MSGLAVAAVNGAVASGLGTSLLSPVAPSAIDGFAVGTLLSGLCLVIALAPRRVLRRTRRQAKQGQWADATHNPMTPNLSGYVPVTAYRSAAMASASGADDSGELPLAVPVLNASALARTVGPPSSADLRSNGKHRSTHGVGPAARRPESRRGSGRHAAKPGMARGDAARSGEAGGD